MNSCFVKPSFAKKLSRQIGVNQIGGGRRSKGDFEMLDGDLLRPSLGVIQKTMKSANRLWVHRQWRATGGYSWQAVRDAFAQDSDRCERQPRVHVAHPGPFEGEAAART